MSPKKDVDNLDLSEKELGDTPSVTDAKSIKRAIKDGLYALARMPYINLETFNSQKKPEVASATQAIFQIGDAFREPVREKFSVVKDRLDELEQSYPNDPDLAVLTVLYTDLLTDFESGRKMEFDDSFEQLMREILQEVASSGVIKQDPDHSDIPEIISALRGCGIEPKYVVSRGDKAAKTVVFFMQSHPNPGISTDLKNAFGVDDSQKQIYEALKAAIDAGLGSIVYGEGLPSDEPISRSLAQDVLKLEGGDLSYVRLKVELDDGINLVGFEDLGLMSTIFHSNKAIDYRSTAHNAFLADNIHDHLSETNDRLAFAVLGALHEVHEDSFMLPDVFVKNTLPFSHTLAYYGYNVVVVDAVSRHIDREAIVRLLKKSE